MNYLYVYFPKYLVYFSRKGSNNCHLRKDCFSIAVVYGEGEREDIFGNSCKQVLSWAVNYLFDFTLRGDIGNYTKIKTIEYNLLTFLNCIPAEIHINLKTRTSFVSFLILSIVILIAIIYWRVGFSWREKKRRRKKDNMYIERRKNVILSSISLNTHQIILVKELPGSYSSMFFWTR